jgi:peptidoglycan hydrolase CwlO-like protein
MKTITLVATASLLLMSCNNGDLERSTHQKDSMMMVLKERDSDLNERERSLNEFIATFNEVERNLDCVAVKQHLIYNSADKTKGELKATQKDRINAQIEAINDLMEQNRTTIADLQKKLKRSGSKNKKLEETVATLTAQIAQKDSELAALNEKLAALNAQVAQLQTSIDTLTSQGNSKSQRIAEQVATIHTAYYLIGRTKDLKEAKVIDKKGGLLGLGRTSQLNENFNRSKFTKIDYTQTTSIPVNSDHYRMVTNHPPDSYKLEKDAKKKNVVRTLVITDPEKFWSVSKYLVIEGTPVEPVKNVSSSADNSEKKL